MSSTMAASRVTMRGPNGGGLKDAICYVEIQVDREAWDDAAHGGAPRRSRRGPRRTEQRRRGV